MSTFRIICADVLDGLRSLPDESVHCCVTSPPYWGLRDYGVVGQLGLERTPEEYVAAMVGVFREVRRVLRADGTCWVNLGDSYTSGGRSSFGTWAEGSKQATHTAIKEARRAAQPEGLKPKDLVGIPWRVAFALQADGWYLRSDIIWHKPNPMPESVTDRPTKAHEYLFLLTRSARYFYDADAIKEPGVAINEHDATGPGYSAPGQTPQTGTRKTDKQRGHGRRHAGFNDRWDAMEKSEQCSTLRNKRDVWTIGTHAYPDAHFAVMPTQLVEPCVMAGSPSGGTVLDPFAGSGTVGVVALRHGRDFIGCELNPTYAEISRRRIIGDMPMFNSEATA